MFSLFIVLLHFSESLATKCLFLNDEPYMGKPTLINMNPVELKYYQFMVSLRCCDVLTPKICFPKETKDINGKAFNMITNKDEAKAMTEHISCGCKCKFNNTTCNSNQKWDDKTFQCECKNYLKFKKDYSWNRRICIFENCKYIKSIADNSATDCDEIIIVMDIVSREKTNTIPTKRQIL